MNRLLTPIAFLGALLAATASFGQTPPSSYYPAPPPLQAPEVEKGLPASSLSSPLPGGPSPVERTEIASEAEAERFAEAHKIVWGRYARIKGAKPGEVAVTRQGPLWVVKGRIDSVAPGTEGDWATIDGVVQRIAANHVQIRGEVAFRVAKVENGTPCKVAGTLNFRRSGKSHSWRLAEGDNPCDGVREGFDLVYDKAVEKKPAAKQPKKS